MRPGSRSLAIGAYRLRLSPMPCRGASGASRQRGDRLPGLTDPPQDAGILRRGAKGMLVPLFGGWDIPE